MFGNFFLFINLIKECDTFEDFKKALKDPDRKDIARSGIRLGLTVVCVILLIVLIVQFTSLNTFGVRQNMKDHDSLIGNWWCPNHMIPFIPKDGVSIVIADFNFDGLNHYLKIKNAGRLDMEVFPRPMGVQFDEEDNLLLTIDGEVKHFRFFRFFGSLMLYNYDDGERFLCSTQPGHVPAYE